MKRNESGDLVFSPSDLIRYLKSPFASWMDRYHLEFSDALSPDPDTEDERLIAETGDKHEADVLADFRNTCPNLVEIPGDDFSTARTLTLTAFAQRAPVVYQAALDWDRFAGYADFIELGPKDQYQVWDTKLARAPKPYYAIQLCCYAEMLSATLAEPVSEKFGIILGSKDRVEFRIEDFIHYYRNVKGSFLRMQDGFSGDSADRPEPLPRADHGRWTSHAERFFEESDHLVQVAGISVGQIKKLRKSGITTVAGLAGVASSSIPKLAPESLERLSAQARLQRETKALRDTAPDSPPLYEVLPVQGASGEPVGLAALPPKHPADVFFDMEGFPLVAGGLEYLFGLCTRKQGEADAPEHGFKDWWAHSREEERLAFEGFIDWVFKRWTTNPGMHIYHYASYEVSAVRRLSTRHDTRQEGVDELLRNDVFVDLYQIVRRGLRIGESSYSIKSVERLYRPKRDTEVSTGTGSMVHYARWQESGESRDWRASPILKGIRDYNEDDCASTLELEAWLRERAIEIGIATSSSRLAATPWVPKEIPPHVVERGSIAARLRVSGDHASVVLADLIDFHRREEKPMWWRMFDRSVASPEALRDDPGCIEGLEAVGQPEVDKKSLVQTYRFDPSQECKLSVSDHSKVMFAHALDVKLSLVALNADEGVLQVKIGQKGLTDKFGGRFPQQGSLIPDEYVSAEVIQTALSEIAASHLTGKLHPSIASFVNRMAPPTLPQTDRESTLDAAIRIARSMDGDCLLIQGPPGTGKTFTASHVIKALLADGKRVGVASNSHKAVVNLISACGDAVRESGGRLRGIKVGGESEGVLFVENPDLLHVEHTTDALASFPGGLVGGTAWLFARPEWTGTLDFLFIDEAGQVSLANAVAMSRSANNLVLLGDQMQLEQPVQGSHPGDSGLSALQFALKDTQTSKLDAPVFHAVVPPNMGLFLGESRRMHPGVCDFISTSIYEGRLSTHPDCHRQRISLDTSTRQHVADETGVVFSPVEHDGNIQRSEEEVDRVRAIYEDLLGRTYTAKDGSTRALSLQDFLFVAPYNAQVRALRAALPAGARVGSVDKFQGQEAPVCILSLCSSYGEYGSRGLGFILDRNRINVAVSRAQCMAVIVADPRIAASPVNSIEAMKLINLFCKLGNKVAPS